MWWKAIIFVIMTGVILASFMTDAPQHNIGESSRIFYYHIPQAWICVVAFAMSMIFSIRYLQTKDISYDDRAVEAARLGLIFCLLATVTGSIFAKVTWGAYWNWDPRQTSVFVLLLIYGAYFALRGALEIEEKRAALAGVYSIFAFVTVPLLIFVIPRMFQSLHPDDSILDENMKFTMGVTVGTIFFSSLAVFTMLYFWMFNIGKRAQAIARRQEELQED